MCVCICVRVVCSFVPERERRAAGTVIGRRRKVYDYVKDRDSRVLERVLCMSRVLKFCT